MKNTEIIYINKSKAANSVINNLLSNYFKKVYTFTNYIESLEIIRTNQNIKAVFIEFEPFVVSVSEICTYLKELNDLDIPIYIFSEDCEKCQNFFCKTQMQEYKYKKMKLPVSFTDILLTLSKDLNLKI